MNLLIDSTSALGNRLMRSLYREKFGEQERWFVESWNIPKTEARLRFNKFISIELPNEIQVEGIPGIR